MQARGGWEGVVAALVGEVGGRRARYGALDDERSPQFRLGIGVGTAHGRVRSPRGGERFVG